MKKEFLINRPRLMLAILVFVSASAYTIDYWVDGSVRPVLTSFLGNLAFLPIYIIVVTLTMEQLLKERERQTLRRKLNMVIGVFFSEIGTRLLERLSKALFSADTLRQQLLVTPQWKDGDYLQARQQLADYDVSFDAGLVDWTAFKQELVDKRPFLVGLLENQNLLEHEAFTDLLWAVFHLVEELEARQEFDQMSQLDRDHLCGDMKRVFGLLAAEWLHYMSHLRHDYPYLFSLAVRMNPMSDTRSAALY